MSFTRKQLDSSEFSNVNEVNPFPTPNLNQSQTVYNLIHYFVFIIICNYLLEISDFIFFF